MAELGVLCGIILSTCMGRLYRIALLCAGAACGYASPVRRRIFLPLRLRSDSVADVTAFYSRLWSLVGDSIT